MRLVLFFFVFLFIHSAMAQNSPDSVSFLLTGKQQKEWIASPWKPVMGIGHTDKKKCAGGESYVFKKDNTVEIRKCENGAITKENFSWTISKEGMDNVLLLGDKKFQIRVKKGSLREVKLRSLVFNKQAISNEVILKYERE